jgi:putative transposase
MAKSTNPFRYFDSSPEVIRLVVMMYVGIVSPKLAGR